MEKNAKELREVASSYKNRIGEVEARIRGASTQPHGGRGSKGPGSSFRVYEVTGCGARYVCRRKRSPRSPRHPR